MKLSRVSVSKLMLGAQSYVNALIFTSLFRATKRGVHSDDDGTNGTYDSCQQCALCAISSENSIGSVFHHHS